MVYEIVRSGTYSQPNDKGLRQEQTAGSVAESSRTGQPICQLNESIAAMEPSGEPVQPPYQLYVPTNAAFLARQRIRPETNRTMANSEQNPPLTRACADKFTGNITDHVAWELIREITNDRELRPNTQPILRHLKISPDGLLPD